MPDWFEAMAAPATVQAESLQRTGKAMGQPSYPTPPKVSWYGEVSRDVQNAAAQEASGATTIGLFETHDGRAPGPRVLDSPDPIGVSDAFTAGTMKNPRSRAKFLAGKRFPNLPTDEAINRYGQIGDDIVYVGDDGHIYREFSGVGPKLSRAFGSGVLPLAGSIAGGVAGAPGGPATSGYGAALGGAAGEAANRIIAGTAGDERTSTQVATDIGVEALLNAVGWKVGDAFGKKIIDRRVKRDINLFDREKAVELQHIAKTQFGIDLTPAEASNLGSLISQQTRLGMGLDEAGDVVRQFYEARAAQVGKSVDEFIGSTPPATQVGAAAQDVGKGAISAAKKSRQQAAAPLYENVVNNPENLVPERDFMQFLEDDYVRGVFEKVHADPLYGVMDYPSQALPSIDAAKKFMDDEIDAAYRAGKKNAANIMKQRRNAMVDLADKHFPSYRNAREVFAAKSPQVTELEKGIEGVLAGLKDGNLKNAARKLLSPGEIAPGDVARARAQFIKQGKAQEWDDVVNQYLRDTWETRATKETQAGNLLNAGGKWRQIVFGTDRAKANMKEAMGPERFRDFEKFMEVLQAQSRVPKVQSMTEPAMQEARREAVEAAPLRSMAKIDIADPLGSFNLREWWIDAAVSDWRTKIAKIVTSPESIKELEKLRTLRGLKPGSQNAINIVSAAVIKSGAYRLGRELTDEPLPPPNILRQRSRLPQ